MCENCDAINTAVRGVSTDLDDALDVCDTDQVLVLLDELEALIGVEAMQPLLRQIIRTAVTHIGLHHGAAVIALN